MNVEIHHLSNVTLAVDVYSAKDKGPLEVVDFAEHDISFVLEKTKVGVGSLLAFEAIMNLGKSNHEFRGMGKVTLCEALPGGFNKISINLRQYDKDLWTSFLRMRDENQARLDKILNGIKGEE